MHTPTTFQTAENLILLAHALIKQVPRPFVDKGTHRDAVAFAEQVGAQADPVGAHPATMLQLQKLLAARINNSQAAALALCIARCHNTAATDPAVHYQCHDCLPIGGAPGQMRLQ